MIYLLLNDKTDAFLCPTRNMNYYYYLFSYLNCKTWIDRYVTKLLS